MGVWISQHPKGKYITFEDHEKAMASPPSTIWAVGNDTFTTHFEDRVVAYRFASSNGATSGMDVWPIQVIMKEE